jgi:two-component system phosphate regulon sensor histidine kinase PhoR
MMPIKHRTDPAQLSSRTPPPPSWDYGRMGLVAAGVAAALLVLLATGSIVGSLIAALGVALAAGASGELAARPDNLTRPPKSASSPAGRDLAGASQLKPVLDGLLDAALLLDADEVVLSSNEPANRLMPVAKGRHISATSRSPELLALIAEAITPGQPQKGEARLLGPIAHQTSIVVTRISDAAEPGMPVLLIVLRDLSEQEKLTRMRADFVANASHELRTPLASLRGFLETIRGPAATDADARDKFIGIMQEQADRMSRLIDDLLSLSRIEMREHVRPLDRIDMNEIVHYVARTVEPLASKAGITVTAVQAPGPTRVRGDRDELIQMLQNLTHNAIKYGREGGSVRIGLTAEGKNAVLTVADDGIGIAPEHLPRLTERFYRVSAKDSRERGGTGLGLAIVKHIVNRHHGELQVVSMPGKGSTFTVRLPAE